MERGSIPWEAWKWLERDFIYAGRKTVPETETIAENNDHHVLWLMEKGGVEIRKDGTRFSVGPGRGILLLPGRFERRFSVGNRVLSIRFRWQWPTGRPLFGDDGPLSLEARGSPSVFRNARGLVSFLERRAAPSATAKESWMDFRVLPFDLDAEAWFELEERVARLERNLVDIVVKNGYSPSLFRVSDDRVLAALTRLQRQPPGESLRVEELAAAVGLSRGRLNDLFREQTGSTPAHVMRERRRRHIRDLLEKTELPVKRIAYEAGFGSLALFSDWCRRAYGHAPTKLRGR